VFVEKVRASKRAGPFGGVQGGFALLAKALHTFKGWGKQDASRHADKANEADSVTSRL